MKASANIKLSPGFKRLLLIIAFLNGLIGVKRIGESFSPPEIYRKDFIQEYLMAKAMLNGVNPYLPVTELAAIWLDYAEYRQFTHPTPHAPALGLLALPLGLLDYGSAAVIWLVFEMACLLASLVLLLRWWGEPFNAATAAVLFGIALGWPVIMEGLWYGQVNLCMLLLLMKAWLSFREGKGALGGALLGVSIALKPMTWPIAVFLVLRRNWKGSIAAGAALGGANLIAVAALGLDCVRDYYLKVGPLVARIYQTYDFNYSAFTLGKRLFEGTGFHYSVPPLLHSAGLATFCTYAAPAMLLIAGLMLALRATSFDASFAVSICVSLLISPVAWPHYLILASIPMVLIARNLHQKNFPRGMTCLAGGLLLLSSSSTALFNFGARLYATRPALEERPAVPFFIGLLTLAPSAALIAILCMVSRMDITAAPEGEIVTRDDRAPDGRPVAEGA
jgi:hypothetical protein